MDHLGRECKVRTAAINAAMAGCRPEYFPIVLAAWDAVMRDRAAKGGGWQSTSGPAPLIVINGPIRSQLAINCTGGIFAAGFRPNAAIPRALGLMLRNAFGVAPHVFDQTTQGIPGRWSICFGENEEESPWEPLATEMGLEPGTNAVSCTLTRTYEFVDNRHTQDPEQLLGDFADTLVRTGSLIFRGQSAGVVFCPEHAQMLANAGMSKAESRTGSSSTSAARKPTCVAPGRMPCPRAARARSAGEQERAPLTPSPGTSRLARTSRSSSPARATRRSRWSSACSASGGTARWKLNGYRRVAAVKGG